MYGEAALSISDEEVHTKAPLEGYTNTIRINLLALYQEGDTEKILVITAGAFDNSHVAQANIDGAVFSEVNGGWQLDIVQHHIVSLGSFGYVPKGGLVQTGPSRYSALLRSGWAGQGYDGGYTTIIAEVGGTLRVIFHLLTSESQVIWGEGGTWTNAWGYTSDLEFTAGKEVDYYDIRVTQHGTNQEGKEFQTVKTYSFSDTEYILLEDHD